MSKAHQLGFSAAYRNHAQNTNPDGTISDAERYPEVSQRSFEEVVWYQSAFRRGLFNSYTEHPSIDNLCINIVLEHGFGSPIYKQCAKYFTLACLQYTGDGRNQVSDNVGRAFVRASVLSMESVLAELKLLEAVPENAQWFAEFANFAHSQEAQFFRQVRGMAIRDAQQSTGFQQHSSAGFNAPQQSMFAPPNHQPPQQQASFGFPAQHQPMMPQAPTPPQVREQLSGVVNTDYLNMGSGSPQPTVVEPTQPVSTRAEIRDNILFLGDDQNENSFMVGTRRDIVGAWATNSVTGNNVDTQAVPGDLILGEGFQFELKDANVRAIPSLSGIAGWEDVRKGALEDVVENHDVHVDYVLDDKWKPALREIREVSRQVYGEAVWKQMLLTINSDGYRCGIHDKVWGESSLLDLINEQHGSGSIDAIPDDDLFFVEIYQRIYPVVKSTSMAAYRWAKRYRDSNSTLPLTRSDDHWYIVLPIWDNCVEKQTLHVCSLLKGTTMDLTKYENNEGDFPETTPASEASESQPVSKSEMGLQFTDLHIPSTNISTIASVVKTNTDNRKDVLVVDYYDASYIILPDALDVGFFNELREAVGKDINNTGDLAEMLMDGLEQGKCTQNLVDQIETLLGDQLMSFVRNGLGLTNVALEATLLKEIDDIRNIILDKLGVDKQAEFVNAEGIFLNKLFAQYDADYLNIFGQHVRAATGWEWRKTNKRWTTKLPSQKTLKLGTGVIPIITQTMLLVVPRTEAELNPLNKIAANGSTLGEEVVSWLKKRWSEFDCFVELVTSDGALYKVDVPSDSEDSAPIITRV